MPAASRHVPSYIDFITCVVPERPDMGVKKQNTSNYNKYIRIERLSYSSIRNGLPIHAYSAEPFDDVVDAISLVIVYLQ